MSRLTESAKLQLLIAFGLVAVAIWAAIAFDLYAMEREAIDRANLNGRNLTRSLAERQGASTRTIDAMLKDLRH